MIAPIILDQPVKKIGTIMSREYIDEAAWSKIFVFLKSLKNIYPGDEGDCKRFVKGVCWILKTGAQWRELPEKYGHWNTVFKRFNDWGKKDIWNALHAFCIEEPDMESVMIDATIARAHPCAAGYKKGQQESEGLGRSKGGFTTKIHAKVDALGNPLKFINTSGQRSDMTQAATLTDGDKDCYVLADKGYDSDVFRAQLKEQGCTPVIPFRSNRISPGSYDKHLYKERHLVEFLFSKLKHFRRIFSRYDKSMRNYMAFLALGGAILWLR